MYAGLLDRAVADVEADGPTWQVLRGHESDPVASALALRLMGSVNRLVLEGREPELAALYAELDSDPDAAWSAFRSVLERHAEELRSLVELPVQTNEVGRCAALLCGFLAVASETALPLRLLEAGASAGLNLRWDRYRYEAEGFSWGPSDSPLTIEFELGGDGRFPAPSRVEVVERCGCDAAPLDPASPEDRLTLLSCIWPDQTTRIERVRAALEIARREPLAVDRERAAPWLERELAVNSPGSATVVFHSIFAQYVPDEEWAAFVETLNRAGERASREAPLAWLRMEPAGPWADVRLTTWPGGEERHLASAGYHGSPVELLEIPN